MNILRICPQLAMAVALIGSTVPITSLANDYAPGFRWDRSEDWVPGAVPGSMAGNPAMDKNGNPAWFYGYTSGGELGSSNPWYAQQFSPLVWNDQVNVGGGQGVWARVYNGPDTNIINTDPLIDKWSMAHSLTEYIRSAEYMPVVEWRNPVGDGAIVDVGGSLKATWEGHYTDNSPMGLVDIAVARLDASEGSFELLYSTTLSNPTEGSALSSFSTITQPLGISDVRLDEGDTLRFTARLRGDEHTTPFWLLLHDEGTDIRLVSSVPEPEQFILLALGLGVLAVRLRGRNLTDRARRQYC
ncbi:PEP-CTERM sorting domain-containing protein [Nitrosovibrio sp. Nv6]|uniref:PEP-CTERM sorting domain-containing protein n=1 Tax=Nitrosovibrio sp. Nv6 TaxID=1855340 RepID=UPI0008BE0047|nr:PEP-CTERM sorting domain-containing protein [Nitrosovibrio sp. Nv6]SEP35770.1 PEP-CTERM protein-sorting domain-containing protein [Nitrosovibrio sp. Nv6]